MGSIRVGRARLRRRVAALRIPFGELLLRSQLADRSRAKRSLVVVGMAEPCRRVVDLGMASRTELASVAEDIPFIAEGNPFIAEGNPLAAEGSHPFEVPKRKPSVVEPPVKKVKIFFELTYTPATMGCPCL